MDRENSVGQAWGWVEGGKEGKKWGTSVMLSTIKTKQNCDYRSIPFKDQARFDVFKLLVATYFFGL